MMTSPGVVSYSIVSHKIISVHARLALALPHRRCVHAIGYAGDFEIGCRDEVDGQDNALRREWDFTPEGGDRVLPGFFQARFFP
jgi:hypothetical protein